MNICLNVQILILLLEAFRLTPIGRKRQNEGAPFPDECQTKSFEKMNTGTLLSVIFKYCSTKNLIVLLLQLRTNYST